MTSWMKERDRLLEQTLAFVQGVTARRPIAVAPAAMSPAAMPDAAAPIKVKVDADSAETDALISLIASSQIGVSQTTPAIEPSAFVPEPIAIADVPQPIRIATPALTYRPAAKRPLDFVLTERDLIAQRVARFRAGQQKTLREREADYTAVQARIRATLGDDPLA